MMVLEISEEELKEEIETATQAELIFSLLTEKRGEMHISGTSKLKFSYLWGMKKNYLEKIQKMEQNNIKKEILEIVRLNILEREEIYSLKQYNYPNIEFKDGMAYLFSDSTSNIYYALKSIFEILDNKKIKNKLEKIQKIKEDFQEEFNYEQKIRLSR